MNRPLSPVETTVQRHFPLLTPQQVTAFSRLEPLYRLWNERINVISRKDIDRLYLHHVLHSLAIAKIITFAPKAKILDIGTGGGFPGIPLAILFPDTRFHLIDSVGKKLNVVNVVAGELNLTNVSTQHIRAEQLTGQYDFAVSRAVAPLDELLSWIRGKISDRKLHSLPNGAFFLKGGELNDELGNYRHQATVVPISRFFPEPFFAEKKVIFLPANVVDSRQ
ncbi:MAG: 16S rRNA (guanine(527)-N(7))-methyltransferase RsmG [Bacteroidales bacterium]|jgi:16S rRNA (guanine527-N7)-methyltransferase|nr:16S rRNA (guanine(527)-N(7))-methyltransferase RsmG [Bacteroidales bacterium]